MEEKNYRSVISRAPFGYAYHKVVYGKNGKAVDYIFLEANRGFEEMTGLPAPEIVNKSVKEVLPGIEKSKFDWIGEYGRIAAEEGDELFEQYSKPLDRWYKVHAFSDKKGYFSTLFIDITQEKKLIESGERYKLLQENSMDAILLTVPDGKIISANRAACEMFGMTEQEILNAGREGLVDTDDPRLPGLLEKRQKQGSAKGELTFKRKDGRRFPGEITSSVYYNKEGEPRTNMIIRDISERAIAEDLLMQQQKKLELNNERLESLLRISQISSGTRQELFDHALNEGIVLTKSKLGFIFYYSEEKRQFILNTWSKGVLKECSVKDPYTVYSLDETGCWGEAVRQRKPIIINDYKAGNPYMKGVPEGHVTLRRFLTVPVIIDGEIVVVAGVANKKEPYDSSDARQLQLLMNNVLKISERFSLIEDLKSAKEKAEESDRLKSAFLANVSHEIRTPMNGILGFIDLLKYPGLDGDTKEKYFGIVNVSAKRLLTTINDIIEISRIESEQLDVNISETDISRVMNYHLDFFGRQAEEKGLSLEMKEELKGKNAIILTDRHKLEGVLTNLLNNAIKFTDEGGVVFGNYIEDNSLVFFVKDTGSGIPADRLEAVFDRFVHAEVSSTRPYEGSGLGLPIAKAYVEKLQGKIWAESEEGRGSSFFFSLPHKKTEEKEPDIVEESLSEKMKYAGKILIAEDDELSFCFLEIVLKEKGYNILRAVNGEEAIKTLENNPDTSLILMDLKMPVMDGFEAARIIRIFNRSIPIIAQTAHVMKGTRERALEAGCNDFITKPIECNKLLSLINKHLDR